MLSPKKHLGFEVGEDRKLAGWPQVAEYFQALDKASDRVSTEEIGKTTEGNPFLVATISSPENLAELGQYRDMQSKLADPRTLSDDGEVEELAHRAKAVCLVTCSMHATEVGATQMSMLLAHHLATGQDADVMRILENVILLLVPCMNPDGLIMVKRWYESTLGTPFEGTNPPFLYHRYAGHDNNRDWFMFTQQETRLLVEHCLNAWHPHIMFDLHQTRSNGMRMILPPLVDPMGPNVDPILQTELALLGTAVASALTVQEKPGVAVNVVYDGYSPSRSYLNYHGGVRILSEAASVRIATPVTLRESDLVSVRGERPTEKSWNHPMPWRGGTWRLRDIVDYDFAAVMACLDHAARYRDKWIRNSYEVLRKATYSEANPSAYLIPKEQHDPSATAELLDIMHTAAVETHEAIGPFSADGKSYPVGTRVVLTGQPYGAFAKTMMEVPRYPDIRQYPGGPPQEPYDVTAHSLPLQMGVNVVEIKQPFEADLRRVDGYAPRVPSDARCISRGAEAYLIRPNANGCARAVNRLLARDATVGWTRSRFEANGSEYPRGTFVVMAESGIEGVLSSLSDEESLRFEAVSRESLPGQYELGPPRIGLYRSHVPTAEEGWTRFVLEEYRFRYTSLLDADLRRGGLGDSYDVIMLPHQFVRHIHHGNKSSHYPQEYVGGLGQRGADSLREFVESGGTLFAWDGGARYAVRYLELPAVNVLASLSRKEFYAPGTLLRVDLDRSHPISYGMPSQAAAMFVNGPAFEVTAGEVVARFPEDDPLLSGLLVGAEKLSGKAAVAAVPLGRGEVILVGFRPHFRAQARGTYKMLFNSLFYSAARD